MNQQPDLQAPPLEAPRLRSLSEAERERVDWKRRDELYEGMKLLSSIRMRVIWNGADSWQESSALLARLYQELNEDVNEINDYFNSPGSGVFRFSSPPRIAR